MENNKYILLNESLKALDKDVFNLLVCSGDYGMGKSHRIMEYVKNEKIEHAYIQSYATPLKFFEILYNNKDKKLIIFDDVNSIDNPAIVGMLKSACWSVLNNDRKVSYHTTSEKMKELELPESFEFKANIVLIFNDKYEGYMPIINRGVSINFDFSFEDKISIFNDIKDRAELDDEVITYSQNNCTLATKNLSIRSLVILSRLKREGFDWELFAKEILSVDGNKDLLESIMKKHMKTKDACEEWMGETGLKERTFYSKLKELKK